MKTKLDAALLLSLLLLPLGLLFGCAAAKGLSGVKNIRNIASSVMGAVSRSKANVAGKQFTPGGGVELSAILGKEKTIERVKKAIEKLS